MERLIIKLVYALVKKDNVEIMFQDEQSLKEDAPMLHGVSIGASCKQDNLEAFYEKIKSKVEVIKEIFTT